MSVERSPDEMVAAAAQAMRSAFDGTSTAPSEEEKRQVFNTYIELEKSRQERREGSRSRWSTPLAVALTGLITLTGNFIFDYLRADNQASIAAISARQQFQYKILEKELADKKTEVERAKVLLFLVRIGVLDQLNQPEIEKIALAALPPDSPVGIPSLRSGEVRQYLNAVGRADIAGLLSDRAIELFFKHEAMTESSYIRTTRNGPRKDFFGSVSIGFGYSLFNVTRQKFEADWGDILDDDVVEKLVPALGLRGDAVDAFLASDAGKVSISYAEAKDNFIRTTFGPYAGRLLTSIPQARELSPDCFGAVMSVAYFKGFTFDSNAVRNEGMRSLKKAIEERDLGSIPGIIRSLDTMRRLPGVQQRLDELASLCEAP
ncbi:MULTISPECIES: hypothetical protein [unclassified Ensifer]|uniref:hypothetical protein n=1 Tax=unclassified Ensifer TaxID=2633371 RepID=UPI000812DF09|nr:MULTISPECIES: hypothetical protein [unclassified Ensifer]OCP05795.1 hypothetical protein BBX50_04740 [Ensifer sp. LC11]